MVGAGLVALAAMTWLRPAVVGPATPFAALGALSIVVFAQRRRPARFAAAVAGILVAGALGANAGDPLLHAERTFFGVYRVVLDAGGQSHVLAHGTTLHGMQSLDPAYRREPLSYYHRSGPFGQAFTGLPSARSAREIAVIGLGVGTLGAYAQPAQRWTFYEIDPAVERIARTSAYFTYLDDCGDACRVILGDARLSLVHESSKRFDVIVLDAFSSDAIPVHLLTREALSLYLSRLAPGGALIFHISNRHLMLGPVLARLASSLHLVAREHVDLKEDAQVFGKRASDWVVMARAEGDLGPLAADARWVAPAAPPNTPLWTDDFSNVLSVLKWR
jgi:SAM-dependent methyltransferase